MIFAGGTHDFAGESEDALEELFIVGRKLVVRLGVRLASGEGRVFTHEVPNVAAPALDKMLGEMSAERFLFPAAQVVGEICKVGFEQ